MISGRWPSREVQIGHIKWADGIWASTIGLEISHAPDLRPRFLSVSQASLFVENSIGVKLYFALGNAGSRSSLQPTGSGEAEAHVDF